MDHQTAAGVDSGVFGQIAAQTKSTGVQIAEISAGKVATERAFGMLVKVVEAMPLPPALGLAIITGLYTPVTKTLTVVMVKSLAVMHFPTNQRLHKVIDVCLTSVVAETGIDLGNFANEKLDLILDTVGKTSDLAVGKPYPYPD